MKDEAITTHESDNFRYPVVPLRSNLDHRDSVVAAADEDCHGDDNDDDKDEDCDYEENVSESVIRVFRSEGTAAGRRTGRVARH